MVATEFKVIEYPKLKGEVWIDRRLIYTGLTPRIGSLGLQVERLKYNGYSYSVENEGPHFGFTLISPFLLTSLTTQQLVKGAKFIFSGPYLGGIRMYSPGPGGIGPHVRHITQLNMHISIRQNQFYFELSGKTGELLPWSYDGIPNHRHYISPQEFKVLFYLTKEQIPSFQNHEGFINAMTGIIEPN